MECKTVTTSAGPVHYADFGGEGAPIVLVHGLGGAHANWMAVGHELARSGRGYRVLAPDLIGFGRTPPAGRSSGVGAQVELLSTFVKEVARGPSVIVGNSMGGLVALVTAASRPDITSRLVLVNAALPRPLWAPVDSVVATLFTLYMTPIAGELFLSSRGAALGPEKVMRSTLRMCGVDPSRVEPTMYEASLALMTERQRFPWSNEAFLTAARSLIRHNARVSRVYEQIRRINAPTMLIQGTADRLVPFVVGESTARLRPDWHFEVMEGVGHTPQIEVPERWLSAVTRFLEAAPSGGQ